MDITHVYVRVNESDIDAFIRASTQDAEQSKDEPGHVDFTLLQQSDDPTRFVMVEIYESADAAAAHKETEQYQNWHDAVEPMMAEPRQHLKFRQLADAR